MNVPLLATDDGELVDREPSAATSSRDSPRPLVQFLPSISTTRACSALFDAICEQEEYYPTRTEASILRQHAPEIARLAGPGAALVEYGSGSSVKTRLLLEAMSDLQAYIPIDISRQHLESTARRLREEYPGLRVEPVTGDYMALDELPGPIGDARRIGFFPGPPSVTSCRTKPCCSSSGPDGC